MIFTNPWGSYDVKALNAVMQVPCMARVEVMLYDDSNKIVVREFQWNNMKRAGMHDTTGCYSFIELCGRDYPFALEFAGEGEVFVYKIIPEKPKADMKFFIAGQLRWGVKGSISVSGDSICIATGGKTDTITVVGTLDNSTRLPVSHPGLLAEADGAIYIRANNEMDEKQMERFINEKHMSALERAVGSGETLGDCAQAVTRGILWNTFYDPGLGRMSTVISRGWLSGIFGDFFGSYLLAEWDTFFAALLSGLQDKALAELQIYNIVSRAVSKGFIPNIASQRGVTADRSQPPVGAYCVYKIFCQFKDIRLLENTYHALMRWHMWWMPNRDGNKDGLLEWGSDIYSVGQEMGFEAHNLLSAKYESGLDNSPMYDNVVFNQQTNTMELTDVGLNSLYALDAWSLARIAEALGKKEESAGLDREFQQMKTLINRELWNEQDGIYQNRYWNGEFSKVLAPTCFYTMIAGIATQEQAKRMLDQHLLNTEEFWGEYVIPSVARNGPGFNDNNYWRGRIWGPLNFLVYEGLRRYGFSEISARFAQKSLDLFMSCWKREGRIYENYNSITGMGNDVPNADQFYHWGGLLGYVAIAEVVDACPWEGLSFGSLYPSGGAVENYPAGNDRYCVSTGKGLSVLRNGRQLFESDRTVRITNYSVQENIMKLCVVSNTGARLRIYMPEGITRIELTANGSLHVLKGSDQFLQDII